MKLARTNNIFFYLLLTQRHFRCLTTSKMYYATNVNIITIDIFNKWKNNFIFLHDYGNKIKKMNLDLSYLQFKKKCWGGTIFFQISYSLGILEQICGYGTHDHPDSRPQPTYSVKTRPDVISGPSFILLISVVVLKLSGVPFYVIIFTEIRY